MSSIIFIGVCQLIGYFLFYLFTWYITNRYDPHIVGAYFLAYAYGFGAYIVIKWGWGQAVLRYCAKFQNDQPETSKFFLSFSIRSILNRAFSTTLLLILAAKILSHLHKSDLLEMALFGFIFFVISKPLNEVIIQYLRVTGRLAIFSVLQYIVGPAGKILFVIAFIHIFSETIESICYGVSVAEIFVGLICFAIIWKNIELKRVFKTNQTFWDNRELKTYTNQIGLNLLLLYGLMRADVIYAAIWLTESDVAAYQVARQLSNIMAISLLFFEPFVSPSIAMLLGNNKKDELGKGFKLSVYYLSAITFVPGAILFIYPEYVLGFFGEFYEEAALPLRLMVVGQMINVLTGQSGYILSMGGHSKYVLSNAIFVIALTLCLMTILVSSFGLVGASAAFAASIITINLLRIWQIKRLENIDWLTFQQVIKLMGWFGFAVILFYSLQFFILNPYSLVVGITIYFASFFIFHFFLQSYELKEFISIMVPSKIDKKRI